MILHVSMKSLQEYLDLYSEQPALMIDREERIVFSSGPFIRLAGYTAESLIGRHYMDIIQPDMTLQQLLSFRRDFTSSPGILSTATISLASGDRLPIQITAAQVELQEDTYCLIGVIENGQRRQLSLLQQFAGVFMQDVNLGVLLIDSDFQLTDISDMACKLLGVVKDEVIGRALDDIFSMLPPESRLAQRSVLEGVAVRNQAMSWTVAGNRYELLVDSSALRSGSGSVVGAYILFKDVTNLRSLEQQVQRSDRLAMIGQIAAGTAHEIRNPLTSIKGFLQMLRRSFDQNGMEKEGGYTDIMLSEINRINDLVSEILLLSKPKHVELEPVDVSSVLKDILPIIDNQAIMHAVIVQHEPLSPMPLVLADKEMLKQVFLNISKNGIEAMGESGILTLTERADREEKWVYIDIHDTGPGIPVFIIDKIFDPFFTTKDEGTGLGLSVCQRIIHDLGGMIRVSSKGFGTTFTICIPFS